MKQYSNNAVSHDNRITAISGQFFVIPMLPSLRCPYHAKVMNTLEITSSSIVINAVFIRLSFTLFLNFGKIKI